MISIIILFRGESKWIERKIKQISNKIQSLILKISLIPAAWNNNKVFYLFFFRDFVYYFEDWWSVLVRLMNTIISLLEHSTLQAAAQVLFQNLSVWKIFIKRFEFFLSITISNQSLLHHSTQRAFKIQFKIK